jgi:hypothetical protein
MLGCINGGYSIDNALNVEIPDLRPYDNEANETITPQFLIQRSCNTTNEEILITLMNTMMDVNQVNASVFTQDLPNDTLDAYVGSSCGMNSDCGVPGKGLDSYETSYNENVTLWMICLGSPVLKTTLTIQAAYLRNWTEPVTDDGEGGLTRGGIAGIVIACVVAFLFISGLAFSLKGTLCCKHLCCCLRNKVGTPNDSPRPEKERVETGLAGSGNDNIAHQPSNQVSIQPSPNKGSDLTRQPLSGLLDPESSSAGHELNSTGQNLLSNGKKSHENAPKINNDSHHAQSQGGLLPNINVNKEGAAQAWNALDQEQHLSGPGSERAHKHE